MDTKTPKPSHRALLSVIAALLLANLVAILAKNETPVFAQRQSPIAGGSGVYVMPAQLSGNSWGCYLLDVDRGNLSCYQFTPGTSELKFVASRNIRNDTQLNDYNTAPRPSEILNLVNKQNQAGPASPVSPSPNNP